MAGNQYPPLSEKEYSETYDTFNIKSRQKDEYEKMLEPIVKAFGSKPVSFLSIGAGFGWMENELVTKYGLKMSFYYAIEPDAVHSNKLKDTVTSWGVEYKIDTNFFSKDMDISQTFDVIFIPQSLYCIKDPFQAVLHAKSFLNPGGRLINLHMSSKSGFYQIFSYFLEKAGKNFQPCYDQNNQLVSEDVVQFLTKAGIDFQVKHDIMKETLEIDDFVRQLSSKNVNGAISFILQTRFENLSPSLKNDILQKAKDLCHKDVDGCYVLPIEQTMIEIRG